MTKVIDKKGKQMSALEEKLFTYAKHHLNVMIIGAHGIGKSTVVKSISEQLGMKFKYYSSSTLDPYSELIGVPVPDKNTKSLDFYRPRELDEAEFVFFDELNRVQNPRVLNAVLEIVQFKSINGEKLNNLKMVWAAINPPGDYQVEELDPALEDRFHIYIKMKPVISMEYMTTKMSEKVARLVKDWWELDLGDDQRKILTPRRIEYIGWMIENNVPWRDAIPLSDKITFPINLLEKRINIMLSGEDELVMNKDVILNRKEDVLIRLEKDPRIAIGLTPVFCKFNEEELFQCRDILEKMPTELINKIIEQKFLMRQRRLVELFRQTNVDIQNYPKICKSFKPAAFNL